MSVSLHPVHNHLPRWQRRLLDTALLGLLGSGLLWLYMHYWLGAGQGPDSLPHPAEPWLMRLHGLMGFAGLFALGMVSALHIPRGWRRRSHRASAVMMLACWAFSLGSAWFLYYLASESNRPALGLWHSAVAGLLCLILLLHRGTLARSWARLRHTKNAESVNG